MMKINEEALKKVFAKNILFICNLSEEAVQQIKDYIEGKISLLSFSKNTNKELSEFFPIVQHAYSLNTNDYIPNIFVKLEV